MDDFSHGVGIDDAPRRTYVCGDYSTDRLDSAVEVGLLNISNPFFNRILVYREVPDHGTPDGVTAELEAAIPTLAPDPELNKYRPNSAVHENCRSDDYTNDNSRRLEIALQMMADAHRYLYGTLPPDKEPADFTPDLDSFCN